MNGTFKKASEVYVGDDMELLSALEDHLQNYIHIVWFPPGQTFPKLMNCIDGLRYLSKEASCSCIVGNKKISTSPRFLTKSFKLGVCTYLFSVHPSAYASMK